MRLLGGPGGAHDVIGSIFLRDIPEPSSVAFGTGEGDHRTLFVVNFAVASPAPTPGVLKLAVGVPGQPLP